MATYYVDFVNGADANNDTISKLVAGSAGSGIAAWLARATGWQLAGMFLGGLAAAARAAGKPEALALYVSQLQDTSEAMTGTAQRALALEMQSRYLHPGWLQAQREEGYAGTLQVLKAVQFAWGWQAVAPDMVRPDHWQSLFEVLGEKAVLLQGMNIETENVTGMPEYEAEFKVREQGR